MKPPISVYKTKQDRDTFLQAYRVLLATWGVEYQSNWVHSQYGDTHVLVSGPVDAKPIIFVPGAQGTAAMWGPIVERLSQTRRLYCLDIIDQVGLSKPEKVLNGPEDCALWLAQTLNGLGHSKVDLVGNSLGAYIAASFALRHPEKVHSLVLTAPAATVSDLNPNYILKVLFTMLWPFEAARVRFTHKVGANRVDPSSPLFKLLVLAMSKSRIISKLTPRALDDEELSSLALPVLIVLGDQDPVNKASCREVAGRLKGLLRNVRFETLPGAGHLWSNEQMRDCALRIQSFLEAQENR